MDLQLKAPDTRFENLLALVPKEFRNQLDSIQTTGEFTLNATTKGSYYTGHLPRLYAELAIHDASLKYPNFAGIRQSYQPGSENPQSGRPH